MNTTQVKNLLEIGLERVTIGICRVCNDYYGHSLIDGKCWECRNNISRKQYTSHHGSGNSTNWFD